MSFRMLIAALAVTLFGAAAVVAAPPPGHPDTDKAAEILGLNKDGDELPNKGEVLEAFNSNSYTYVHFKGEDGEEWLAAPRFKVKAGDTVLYSEGRVMTNFYSKVHNRTFERIRFVASAVVKGAE